MPDAAPTLTGPDANVSASSKKRRMVLVGVLVLAIAGAGYWFVLKPGPEEKQPEPGEVVTLEPVQLNLSAGRYLRVGVAMQMTTDVKEEVDGSKALDATIALFSGLSVPALENPSERARLKTALKNELMERYPGEIMDVYFTEFVTQ